MLAPFFAAFLLAVLPVSAAPTPPPAAGPTKPPPPPPAWFSRINAGPAGNFPPPRSFVADYRVTWADVEAARIEARCVSPEGGAEIQTAVRAATVGGARLLYKLDASGLCVANRRTLRPIRFEQTLDASGKHNFARVDFTAQEAVRSNDDPTRKPAGEATPAKSTTRRFRYPGLLDMHTALLYLRSLPLANGDTRTFAVMAANTPYLVTVKVVGRERVRVRAGEFPAVVCALSLEKVNKRGELEEHKGFKSARAWLSDDAGRMLLKIETEVFVGSVNMELEKVTY